MLGENVNISCKQPNLMTVDCAYRIVRPQAVVDVRAQFGEIEVPRPDFYLYPIPGSAVSVVFFLIDTSDPQRSSVRSGQPSGIYDKSWPRPRNTMYSDWGRSINISGY